MQGILVIKLKTTKINFRALSRISQNCIPRKLPDIRCIGVDGVLYTGVGGVLYTGVGGVPYTGVGGVLYIVV